MKCRSFTMIFVEIAKLDLLLEGKPFVRSGPLAQAVNQKPCIEMDVAETIIDNYF